MASDWIIIGAIVVLVAGVFVAFKTAASEPPNQPGHDKRPGKSTTKGTI